MSTSSEEFRTGPNLQEHIRNSLLELNTIHKDIEEAAQDLSIGKTYFKLEIELNKTIARLSLSLLRPTKAN